MPHFVPVCAVCGNTQNLIDGNWTHYLNLPEPFKVFQCPRCGLRWLNPAPTQQEYYELYDVAYFSSTGKQANILEWTKEFPRAGDYENDEAVQRQRWYQVRLKRLHHLAPEAKTILDVGAATGEFLSLARQEGWDVAGLEISEYACQKAHHRWKLDLEQTDLEHFDANGQTFDVIHLSHVFEHFVDPQAALSQLRALMSQDSLLIIEIPNQFRSVLEHLVRTFKRVDHLPRNLYSIHHPYFYGVPQISQLFRQNGLSIISLRTHFPERWEQTKWSKKAARLLDFLAACFGNLGQNIEVIARKSKA